MSWIKTRARSKRIIPGGGPMGLVKMTVDLDGRVRNRHTLSPNYISFDCNYHRRRAHIQARECMCALDRKREMRVPCNNHHNNSSTPIVFFSLNESIKRVCVAREEVMEIYFH
jgi:hypothetical protein